MKRLIVWMFCPRFNFIDVIAFGSTSLLVYADQIPFAIGAFFAGAVVSAIGEAETYDKQGSHNDG